MAKRITDADLLLTHETLGEMWRILRERYRGALNVPEQISSFLKAIEVVQENMPNSATYIYGDDDD